MCAYTHGDWAHRQVSPTFWVRKTLTNFSCAPDRVRASCLWISSPTLYQLSHPVMWIKNQSHQINSWDLSIVQPQKRQGIKNKKDHNSYMIFHHSFHLERETMANTHAADQQSDWQRSDNKPSDTDRDWDSQYIEMKKRDKIPTSTCSVHHHHSMIHNFCHWRLHWYFEHSKVNSSAAVLQNLESCPLKWRFLSNFVSFEKKFPQGNWINLPLKIADLSKDFPCLWTRTFRIRSRTKIFVKFCLLWKEISTRKLNRPFSEISGWPT